ncbi:MAG: InlB B-repeat-containing protein [Clostridia bacterium]|nr:InlB B-repeat-containing protein [Clostridia bacterium]
MKKFIKYLFIFCVLISGVFVKNLTVSNEIVASAASTYETDFINAFADDENLSRIQSSSLSQTSFNILDRVDYEFYDQDQYGTCYAFSLAQMLNLSYEYKTGEHIRLSAIALALQFRNIFFNDGSYGFEIIQNSYNLDYVSEYDFPYEIAKMYYDAQTTTKDVNLNFEGKEILDVEEYYYFPLISSTFSTETRNLCVENIKKALVLDGALTMGINYTVKTSGEYLIYEPTVASIGGHAMTVVGFDDNFPGSVFGHATNGAFIIMNSWGANDPYLYISYEDVSAFNYLMGAAGFIDADERAEEVSSVSKAYYGLQDDLFYKQDLTENLELGYLIENTTGNSYLSQIDLQPLYQDFDIYYHAADIKLYVGANTLDLENGSFEYIGDFDIAGGVNKIVLNTPIEVAENFSIKIVITDDVHKFSYLDEGNQNFTAYYKLNNNWSKVYLSEDNYSLVRTPYYVRALFTDGTDYDISYTNPDENNHQTNSVNAVEFDLSSSANTEIESVGVQIFRNTTANASFSNFSMVEDEVSSEFEIVATTSSVKLTKKAFSGGTYKVVININNGEKKFTKFLFFDDGIDIHCFDTYRYIDIWEDAYKYFSVYSNTLSANIVNITIPDSYKIFRVSNNTFLDSIFAFGSTDITFSAEYSTDTSQRISRAEVTFLNSALGTSRKVTFNFIYDKANLVFYVTKLANATHSNPQTVSANYNHTLTAATAPNHTFAGWYTDESFTTPATNIYEGKSGQILYYYAKFVEKTVPSVAKKASYDDVNNVLTVTLDFSGYNLAIYDTIQIYNIRHTFKTITVPEDFNILKTALNNNKYEYQIYVEPADMNAINTITFNLMIMRWDYREQYGFYDTLSQSVSLTDKVKITFTKTGNGEVYNSLTGDIIESGDLYLPYGSKLDINFVPEDNHQIKSILVDGISIIVADEYCFANLIKNYTFAIEFELITYQISALVTGDGSLDKALTELYERGTTVTYNFTPNEGSYLKMLQVDGVSLSVTDVTSYTFFDIKENHVIIIEFAPYEYTIEARIVGEGDIGQPLIKNVNYGDDVVYTFTPNVGYHLKQITVDGTEIALTNNYTFENVTQNHIIYVKFEKDVINITLTVSGNGNIKAKKVSSGSILENTATEVTFSVEYEESLIFEFAGDEGFTVGSILFNGATLEAQDSLTLNSIIDDVELTVFFVLKTYELKVVISGSGVTNHGNNIVRNHGDSVSYTFTPSTGYEIEKVIVDGVDKGVITEYTFENITSSHIINITFVIQKFEVKWFNYNGTLITTSSFNYGTVPTATFDNPTRPAEGNYVYDFTGWNTAADGSGFEITPATENISYYAQFYKHLVQFAIKVSAGANGEISPKGNASNDVMVEYGANKTFTFVPSHGYHVSKVYVDGKTVENLESYTFENVTGSHTISVVFKRNDFKATVVSDDEMGTVSGSRWFENGERATYKITPKEGFIVESVFVNGKKVNCTDNTIVVENVTEDIEIVVSYVSAKDSKTFTNFTKTLIFGGVGIAVIGVGFAVVYFIKIKGKAKKTAEDDEYDEK